MINLALESKYSPSASINTGPAGTRLRRRPEAPSDAAVPAASLKHALPPSAHRAPITTWEITAHGPPCGQRLPRNCRGLGGDNGADARPSWALSFEAVCWPRLVNTGGSGHLGPCPSPRGWALSLPASQEQGSSLALWGPLVGTDREGQSSGRNPALGSRVLGNSLGSSPLPGSPGQSHPRCSPRFSICPVS